MDLLHIIILSIVQGITEWLPISSSGHLVILQELFNMNVPIYYDILLHVATLIVILLVYYKEILKIINAFIKRDFKSDHGKLGIYIIIGSIPTAIIGLLFKDIFLSFFTNLKVVGVALLVTSLILFLTKYVEGKRKLSIFDSFFIGAVQGLAIIPGISRSGTTISTGLLLGIKREHVATFSFLLAVPAILGASILEYSPTAITTEIIIGMIITIIIGYIALKLTIKIIQQKKFYYFAYYCLILGIIVLFL